MARIESRKPIQLTFPEPSTVIVIPKASEQPTDPAKRKLYPSERWSIERYIPVSAIRQATQEFLEFGADAPGGDGETQLLLAMVEARRNNITHEDFQRYLDEQLHMMRYQIGYNDPRLDEARELILENAEPVWTAISDEELDQLLQGRQVPAPQKQR